MPLAGSVVNSTAIEGVGRIVIRIGEAEVACGERVGHVFVQRDRTCVVPVGASFTLVTLTTIVLGDGSRSMPPLAVPPSSCTWKVKLASGVPLALAAPRYVSRPASISAFADKLAGADRARVGTADVMVSVPTSGSVVMRTASQAVIGESLGSLKPKSLAVNV